MENTNRIIQDTLFKDALTKIKELELNRKFCKHNMSHFLSVARIAYILNLEQALSYSKDVVYTAALLHDLGKYLEYNEGVPHEIAGVFLAQKLLLKTNFTIGEKKEILEAIEHHRDATFEVEKSLSGILYTADKLSRSCFACDSQSKCYWDKQKKNMEITY